MVQLSEKKLRDIKKTERKVNKSLFVFCAIITLIAMSMAIIEFFSRGVFPSSGMGIFYIGVLFIYSIHKEMLRWIEEKDLKRQGEWFVYSWILLTVFLYIINFSTKRYFSYSSEGTPLRSLEGISVIALEVCVIFVLTRLSKTMKIILSKKQKN